MKKQFVPVSNYKRFLAGIAAVELRGAREAGLLLVTSQAGYGKTATITHWAVQANAIHLRATVHWTPRYFLTELARELSIAATGQTRDILRAVSDELRRKQTMLVVDEVNHCFQRGGAPLEAIRDVIDMTEAIVVLVGHEDVQGKIARYPQIRSRVAQVVQFEPASDADIRLLADALIEPRLDDDLIAEIQRQSVGRTREVMNALATCERVAARTSSRRLGVKDLGGTRLVYDWQPGRARAGAL